MAALPRVPERVSVTPPARTPDVPRVKPQKNESEIRARWKASRELANQGKPKGEQLAPSRLREMHLARQGLKREGIKDPTRQQVEAALGKIAGVKLSEQKGASQVTKAPDQPVKDQQQGEPQAQTIKTGEIDVAAQDAAKAEIRALIRNNQTLSATNELQIKLLVQKAQLAGESKEQLRADLDESFTVEKKQKVKKPDGTEVEEPYRDPKRELLIEIGLPVEKPENPRSEVTAEERSEAQNEKIKLIGQIIKSSKEGLALIPEADVREAAKIVTEQAIQRINDPKRAEQIRRAVNVDHRRVEDLALVVIDPDKFATDKSLEVADIIQKRVQRNRDLVRKYGEGKLFWRLMSAEQKAQALADEQFGALVANPGQLKQIEDMYKKLKNPIFLIFQFILALSAGTAYQLVVDQVGETMEGR